MHITLVTAAMHKVQQKGIPAAPATASTATGPEQNQVYMTISRSSYRNLPQASTATTSTISIGKARSNSQASHCNRLSSRHSSNINTHICQFCNWMTSWGWSTTPPKRVPKSRSVCYFTKLYYSQALHSSNQAPWKRNSQTSPTDAWRDESLLVE